MFVSPAGSIFIDPGSILLNRLGTGIHKRVTIYKPAIANRQFKVPDFNMPDLTCPILSKIKGDTQLELTRNSFVKQ